MEVSKELQNAKLKFIQQLDHIKTLKELEELNQIIGHYYAQKAEACMNALLLQMLPTSY